MNQTLRIERWNEVANNLQSIVYRIRNELAAAAIAVPQAETLEIQFDYTHRDTIENALSMYEETQINMDERIRDLRAQRTSEELMAELTELRENLRYSGEYTLSEPD